MLSSRRRMGKTELLREFATGKPAVFFIAALTNDSEQLAAFSQQVYAALHDTPPAGGMPYYLNTFSAHPDLPANIRAHILDEQAGTLFNEPQLLLMEALREPGNYFSILRAIARGNARGYEITWAAGIASAATTGRQLAVLRQMRLVIRKVPATESQPEKSRKGTRQIDDHFLKFWFRHVHPRIPSLELGRANAVLKQRILPDPDHFCASSFKEAAIASLTMLAQGGELGFHPERIGGWRDAAGELGPAALSKQESIYRQENVTGAYARWEWRCWRGRAAKQENWLRQRAWIRSDTRCFPAAASAKTCCGTAGKTMFSWWRLRIGLRGDPEAS